MSRILFMLLFTAIAVWTYDYVIMQQCINHSYMEMFSGIIVCTGIQI